MNAQAQPQSIDALISMIQDEFPNAGIRITGRSRTIHRQAELMAQRIRADRQEFEDTYRDTQHIREMIAWVEANPNATEEQTVTQFVSIIRAARARGAVVSNHLSDHARDISWPNGTPAQLVTIEARITALGGVVLQEPDAAGGAHWHIDWGVVE